MLDPEGRLLFQILLGLGLGQIALLISALVQISGVKATQQAQERRISNLEDGHKP